MKNKIIFFLVLTILMGAVIFSKTRAQSAIVINVKDAPYSAKGDGVTDDTAAIQAAVNAAFTAGGGSTGAGSTVYFPNGKYIVRSVKIRPNISYLGESKENTIIQRPPASIKGGEPVSITRENTAKLTTSQPHGLSNGSVIFFSGINQPEWSGLNGDRDSGAIIVRKIDDYSVHLFDYKLMELGVSIEEMAKGSQTAVKTKRYHKLSNGDKISFFNITQAGWTGLNGNSYPITKIDGLSFYIDFNSSNLSDYNPDTDPGIHYKNLDLTGITSEYNQADPGLVRLQEKWLRTFTTDGVVYSSDIDSGMTSFQNLTFDGNSGEWGPYKNYEQEQAALLFLSSDNSKNGRLKARVENCNFRNGIGDAIAPHHSVDIVVDNVLAENVFRGGFVSTADNDANNRIRIRNFTTKGKIDPTGIDFEPYGDTSGTKPSEIYMENVNVLDGDFDLAVEKGTKVEGRNIYADAPVHFYFEGSNVRFYDSTFKMANTRMLFPNDVIFERCKFIVTEKFDEEAARTLYAFFPQNVTNWASMKNASSVFKQCEFSVDSNVEADDTVRAIQTDYDVLENNNFLYLDQCQISEDFDEGIATGYRGGHWRIKDTAINAKRALNWSGYLDNNENHFMDIAVDGMFSFGSEYMKFYGNNPLNTLNQKNIQISASNNNLASSMSDISQNTYSGSRLILGEIPPTSTTHGFPGDVYRLKNPVSGEVHEWKCLQPVFNTKSVAGAWQAQPILPAIASLSNLPESPTTSQSANITAGGTNITAYKYKLDDGSWSAEAAISNPINITNLANGSHTVSVIGKNSAGEWQPQDRPTTHTWLILGGSITPPPTPIYSKSDLNQDSLINQTDLDILKADFLRLTANLTNPRSDINSDGQCTARDLGILMSGWE